jgi:hypothetical protein
MLLIEKNLFNIKFVVYIQFIDENKVMYIHIYDESNRLQKHSLQFTDTYEKIYTEVMDKLSKFNNYYKILHNCIINKDYILYAYIRDDNGIDVFFKNNNFLTVYQKDSTIDDMKRILEELYKSNSNSNSILNLTI